jgi:murein L,D-transpeptidase YcbB/YkuD
VYREIEQSGGWDSITATKKNIVPGDSGRAVTQLKKRLIASRDYPATDTSANYTKAFKAAVQQAQKRFGFPADGKVSTDLVKQLNMSVTERIKQVLINMERMRWMPKETSGVRLVANIPEYKLHLLDNNKEVFNIDIVVGKTANKTVIFNDQLKYVVFSPYWNIPRSIVRNEILPAMQKNSNYLRRKNMEQTGYSNGLPVIRQNPGGSNALGKVKFIFPNNYLIYFHDTPAKTLFNKRERAFSHGCIRLAEPFKLASYLLKDQPAWTPEKITAAMNASKEQWVPLEQTVPVVISYFTAWIDGEGLLNLRDDIYGLDKNLAERLFENSIQ